MCAARLPWVRQERSRTLQKYLLIAAGGALGSMARYWVAGTLSGRAGTRFPWGTFVVNITACVIIGFTITWLGRQMEVGGPGLHLPPVVFMGANSTFPPYEGETFT